MYFFKIITLLIIINSSFEIDVIKYLHEFGYFDENNFLKQSQDNESLIDAIETFQEYYNLPIDGELNNETLDLMNLSRCGLKDVEEFTVGQSKEMWNFTDLSWSFPRGSIHDIKIASQAFEIWSKHTNFVFVNSRRNPNIIITYQKYNHKFYECYNKTNCPSKLDGPGVILGHAFYPSIYSQKVEIHLDKDEKWCYYNCSSLQISLLSVLLHEIGHTLGIKHLFDKSAIMYAYYSPQKNLTNIDLSKNDIYAVQTLYGKKTNTSKIYSTTMSTITNTSTTQKTIVTTTDQIIPELCLLHDINTYLIVEDTLFIFYEQWVWYKKLDDDEISGPLTITQWLPFLPENFAKINAIYQRLDGNIALFSNDGIIFVINPDNLSLLYTQNLTDIGISKTCTGVRGVVNTYRGQTYIYCDNGRYFKIKECTFDVTKFGLMSNDFPGIPTNITGVFRYTDGLLYFFDEVNTYSFNEFSKRVKSVRKNGIDHFNIYCTASQILIKIKTLFNNYLF